MPDYRHPAERDRMSDTGGTRFWEIDWADPDRNSIVDFVMFEYNQSVTRNWRWRVRAIENLAWARGYQNLVWKSSRGGLPCCSQR